MGLWDHTMNMSSINLFHKSGVKDRCILVVFQMWQYIQLAGEGANTVPMAVPDT